MPTSRRGATERGELTAAHGGRREAHPVIQLVGGGTILAVYLVPSSFLPGPLAWLYWLTAAVGMAAGLIVARPAARYRVMGVVWAALLPVSLVPAVHRPRPASATYEPVPKTREGAAVLSQNLRALAHFEEMLPQTFGEGALEAAGSPVQQLRRLVGLGGEELETWIARREINRARALGLIPTPEESLEWGVTDRLMNVERGQPFAAHVGFWIGAGFPISVGIAAVIVGLGRMMIRESQPQVDGSRRRANDDPQTPTY